MTSKLPIYQQKNNLTSIQKIANQLETHLQRQQPTNQIKNEKILKKFSANFNGRGGDGKLVLDDLDGSELSSIDSQSREASDNDDNEKPTPAPRSKSNHHHHHQHHTDPNKVTKKNWKLTLQDRDDQIDKLVDRVNELHTNNQAFTMEIQKLQNKTCDQCQEQICIATKWQEEQQKSQKDNQQLRDDVKMMKILVYRLNVQLERHQDLLRQPTQKKIDFIGNNDCGGGGAGGGSRRTNSPMPYFTQTDQQKTTEIIDWGSVNTTTLAPLLQAYTEMISEKTDLVEQYENELTHFTGKLKDILKENELIQTEMDEVKMNSDTWTTERTRIQAQLDICRQKAEVQSKRADLAKEKLVEVVRCYEQKLQSQHLDIERLQEAYGRAKGELTALRSIQQNPETIVESLKECQRLFEDLKNNHDTEKCRLNKECDQLRNRILELEEHNRSEQIKIINLKSEIHQKSDELNSLEKKTDALRQSLARVRLSRESFRNRLRSSIKWTNSIETGQRKIKNTWNDVSNVDTLLRQKESQVQTIHMRYLDEIEKLTRKVQQRDEMLKKVLQTKVRRSNNVETKRNNNNINQTTAINEPQSSHAAATPTT